MVLSVWRTKLPDNPMINSTGASEVVPEQSRKVLVENRANRPNKFEERRKELAVAALEALAEKGYANTSLRDIAAKSGFALGTLHYYFADKVDLISYCTRNYKLEFINNFNALIANATDIDVLINDFVAYSVQSVAENNLTHRLWYDIKSQCLFEDEFKGSVAEIDTLLADMVNNLVIRAEKFTGKQAQLSGQRTYWMLDGFFQYFLRAFLSGDNKALENYRQEIKSFLDWLLA